MTLAPEVSGATVLDGLRTWSDRQPDRVAITDGTTSLTFVETLQLVLATSALARTALADAAPGSFLPVLVDRSVDSAVAVLACIAGRVPFFPIDAKAAPEFQRSLMHRAGDAGWYLAGAQPVEPIEWAEAIEVSDDAHGVDAPFPAADSAAPAVVIFSSGSTGKPKGIVLSHAAIEERWRSRDLLATAVGPERREPLTPALDAAWGINIVGHVASGFTEYVVDVGRTGLPAFLATMADFRPTAMVLPSQLARVLRQVPERSLTRLPSLRVVNVGSEGLRFEYLDGLRRILEPDARIIHNLSSSEASRVFSNTFAIGEAPSEGIVPIGRPISPSDLRLVSVEGHPDDVLEVHASGPIATCYLDDAELSETRFYADADGRRWWRSADLVSADAQGVFRHAGRMDDVVKVGSKLASPTDVTTALMSVDGIQAAVTVPVVTDGNTRLVAHVEVADGSGLTLESLRAALAARLPVHAVPSAIMRHRHLPTNARGKIDRAALAAGPYEPW